MGIYKYDTPSKDMLLVTPFTADFDIDDGSISANPPSGQNLQDAKYKTFRSLSVSIIKTAFSGSFTWNFEVSNDKVNWQSMTLSEGLDDSTWLRIPDPMDFLFYRIKVVSKGGGTSGSVIFRMIGTTID